MRRIKQWFKIQIIYRVNSMLRNSLRREMSRRLITKDISIISSNCVGAMICKDLDIRFNSPFVNLWIKPKDFIKLCQDLQNYMECPLIFIKTEEVSYPVGCLKDILIYFQHYQNEEDAKNAWDRRKKRIHYDNIFIMMTDRDGCTDEDLEQFNQLKFENKVVFTHLPVNIGSTFYIKGFEKESEVGMLMGYRRAFSPLKCYDDFDYVNWFNGGEVLE